MLAVDNISRIALGTAQFGLDYGIANRRGRVLPDEIAVILRYARNLGVDTLDTAAAYGNAEEQLGRLDVRNWRVVSKLPSLPEGITDTRSWVEHNMLASLHRLRVDRLYGLLLHRPQDLLTTRGEALYGALRSLKERAWVDKVGISIYDPDELGEVCNRFDIDLIQAPLNVLDRRLLQSGWLARVKSAGIEVHIRSVFLQGLLLMSVGRRPAPFRRWQGLWDLWHTWLADVGCSPLSACLGFVLNQPGIDRVIVGAESLGQFQEILTAASDHVPALPDDLCSDDPALINPSQWHFL